MFGKCPVCDEKEKRIFDLQTQVETLKRMLLPPPPRPQGLPVIDMQTGQALELSPEEEVEAIINERDALLNGTY